MSEGLKKGWRTWRFDQMATIVNDRIDDPSEANVDYYVGLEHLDSESLTIRRWGTPADVNATKLLFRKGDIIFGRRRVYQRKLAVAHFDGICSAHAMVLRAKPEVVLPEFLPFFMQSDLFMERAKQISVGSLSPTINWKTLAMEEFALPPIEEQRKAAYSLALIEDNINILNKLSLHAMSFETLYIDSILVKLKKSGALSVSLGDLCIRKPEYGVNAPAVTFNYDLPRFLRITDIDDDGNLINDEPVSVKVNNMDNFFVKKGDLLFARTGNTVGKVFHASEEINNMIFAGYLVRFIPDPKKSYGKYLFLFTRSSYYRNWLACKVRVGAQPNINAQEFSELPILIPITLHEQESIVNKWMMIKTFRNNLECRISNLISISNLIMEQLSSEVTAVV
jgi:restriction endonuclease S subunit